MGNAENAGYQHFLHFPQCFQKPFSSVSLKLGILWKMGNNFCFLHRSQSLLDILSFALIFWRDSNIRSQAFLCLDQCSTWHSLEKKIGQFCGVLHSFQQYSSDITVTVHHLCMFFVSLVLNWDSEESCP